MALDLPPPPDLVGRSGRPRSSGTLAAVAAVGVLIAGLCICGGVMGLMSYTITSLTEIPAQQIGPWLELLVDERYAEASARVGPGVTADQIKAAVDYHIGAPLRSFELVRTSVAVGVGPDGRATQSLVYLLEGSRESQRVQIQLAEGAGGASTIAIAEWGIVPSTELPPVAPENERRPDWGWDEEAPGPAEAEQEAESESSDQGFSVRTSIARPGEGARYE